MVVVVVAKFAWWWLWIPRNPLALLVAPSWHGLGGGCKKCLVVVVEIFLLVGLVATTAKTLCNCCHHALLEFVVLVACGCRGNPDVARVRTCTYLKRGCMYVLCTGPNKLL